MRRALIGSLLLLHHHIAAALPGWASGNLEVDGDTGWVAALLVAGFLGAVGTNKEFAAKQTPVVTDIVMWLGRVAAAAVVLTIVLAPFTQIDTFPVKGLLVAWAIAKAAHALYICGMEAGLRIESDERRNDGAGGGLDTKHRPNRLEQLSLNAPDRVTPRLVAWAPSGLSAPVELTAVRLPPGTATESQWWQALSERVSAMAKQAGEEQVRWACRVLGSDVGMAETTSEAGQVLVEGNLNLRTHLNLAVLDRSPFPASVSEPDPYLEEVLVEVDLEAWVELARSMTHPGASA